MTLLLFILTFNASVYALDVSDYRFHSIPETSYYGGIHSIVKDKIGRVWFSGSDAVYMYDGISFTRLNDKLISKNPAAKWAFLQVVRAGDDNIYVGTNHGLMMYDYGSATFSCVLDGKISQVVADTTGVLWLIRNDTIESYSSLEGANTKTYPFPQEMDVNPTNLSLSCSLGKVFVSTNGILYGLDVMFGAYDALVKVGDGQRVIRDVECSDDFCFVLTARDGIYAYDAEWVLHERFCLPPEYEKSSVAKELYYAGQGVFWAATQSGLFVVDSRISKTELLRSNIRYPYSLPNSSIWTIYPDPDGGVWLGTYGGKLAYMPVSDNGGNWFKATPGGLSHSIVSCFAEDKDGNIWIGTEGGGVNYWDRANDRYIYYTQENNSGIRSNMIKKLSYDSSGRLIVSSFNGGMQYYDAKSNSFLDLTTNALPFMVVYDFIKEGGVGYWVSDPDSPLRFWDIKNDEVKTCSLRYEDRPLSPKIEAMFRGEDGNICLVASAGLYTLDKDCNVISYKYIENAPYAKNDLSCYCHASDSIIWFGTKGGGVNILSKDGNYTSFADASGNSLDGKTVFGILEDEPTGDIWFSTDDGLYYYDKSTDAILRSTIDNSNLCGAYYVRSCFKTRSGEMLFGGTDGFIIFDPAKVGSNTHKAKPFFVSLKINNELVKPASTDSPLSKDASAMDNHEIDGNVVLSHKQSNFEISFSSDSYQDANKNRYAYRMRGLSDNWNVLPYGQRSVAFYDISSGKYVFELKSANGDGLWGDKVISIGFTVKSSPFLSVWAYIIYLMIIAIASTIFILIAKHRRKLEAELDQKDAEISELYSKKYVAGPSEIVVTSLEDELFKKALVYVEKNIDNSEYSVEDFVSDMAMGRTALYQRIHAITGLSIKEFILDIRLKRAAKLLKESDKTIAEISYMTGFVNPKYFSVCFKRRLGKTPTEFKKEND